MTRFNLWLATLAMIIMVGCAHGVTRGAVAMKVSDTEAHIGLGDKEVTAGDEVFLYKNVCNIKSAGKAGFSGCEKVKVGEGEVTRTLNENYSVIRVSPGTEFDEGTIVERRKS